METYLILFAAGFIGSLHCVGMCGGIVSTYSLCMQRAGLAPSAGLLAHVLYNTGRVATYAFLGAAAGLLGDSLTGFGRWEGMASALAVFAGVVMVAIGLGYLGLFPKLMAREAGALLVPFRRLAALMMRPTPAMGLPIGLGMGFLPCGLVYAMLANAAGSGSALAGGLVMLSFGLGTIPALLVVGTSFQRFSQKLRGGALKTAAVAVILVGLFTIWRGFASPSEHADHLKMSVQPSQHDQQHPSHGHAH